LKHGDEAIGYDLESLSSNLEMDNFGNQRYLPDFILIRKHYEKKMRIWKLQRMEMENEEEPIKKKEKGNRIGDENGRRRNGGLYK